jgi:hypothetical protein
MNKIGILTFHRSINYGVFLQSYSLAKKIHEVTGYEVEIIDYQRLSKSRHYQLQILISTDVSLLGPYRNYKRYFAFKNSLTRLPLSSKTIITNNESELQDAIKGKYDILISGSDAVFNFTKTELPNAYWLHGFENVKKMSYAASAHGMDFDSIPLEDYRKIDMLLKDFSYIGVRDEETLNMIKKANSSLKIHRNCDPTVFLDLKGYTTQLDKVLYEKYKIPKDKKMIGIMVYDRNLGRRIKKRYGKNYLLVSIYRSNPYADVYLYDLDPFEWSCIFSKFDLLITKYFHGTLLSFKNNTPTITIDYSKNVDKYATKLKDLLTRFGLSECFFTKERLIKENSYDAMFEIADEILKNPDHLKHKIVNSLHKELKYSESFFNALLNEL